MKKLGFAVDKRTGKVTAIPKTTKKRAKP
jgi:hypothetical protein